MCGVALPGKHGRNRLDNYLHVHDSYMADLLQEGFVVADGTSFTFLPGLILLEGTITCLDDIALDVEKEIVVLSGRGLAAWVQTRRFRYHAWLPGARNILRYESPHEHRPTPHKHEYDTFGDGRETQVLDLHEEDQVPTLGEVLRELQGWHQQHVDRIR